MNSSQESEKATRDQQDSPGSSVESVRPGSGESNFDRQGIASDAVNGIKGFCMGVCDAVPGVSGGTVALIVGIYERLFIAISHIDRRLIGLIRNKEWSQAARHVDARFLAALVVGLGMGYVIMSMAIKYLMADDSLRALTLASFGGMVLGSAYIVAFRIGESNEVLSVKQKTVCAVCGVVGMGLSLLIACQNTAAATGEVSLFYLFLCVVIAICAMILPGISGSMLLLIFGVYYYVLDIPRNLIHLENVGSNLISLGVVLSGCLFGLLTFGRVIRWLLQTYRAATLSTMLGLMIGSLIVLWPFQNRIEPVIEHHKPTYQCFVPEEFGLLMVGVIVCIVFFAAAVILVDLRANRIANTKLSKGKEPGC